MYVIGDKQMSDKEAEDFALEFGSDVKTLAEQSGGNTSKKRERPTVRREPRRQDRSRYPLGFPVRKLFHWGYQGLS